MKDSNKSTNRAQDMDQVPALNERATQVLSELQVKGENGVSDMYTRALSSVKTRLIMDDEYEPSENMALVRVLTMLEHDLDALIHGAEPLDELDEPE